MGNSINYGELLLSNKEIQAEAVGGALLVPLAGLIPLGLSTLLGIFRSDHGTRETTREFTQLFNGNVVVKCESRALDNTTSCGKPAKELQSRPATYLLSCPLKHFLTKMLLRWSAARVVPAAAKSKA